MNFELLFITYSNGLLLIDVPAYSPFIVWAIGFWSILALLNFVLNFLRSLFFFT